jgi:competence protein ComEA
VSTKERRALAVLLGLAVFGHLVRAVAGVDPPAAAPALSLLDSAGDGDPGAHLDSTRRLAAPLGPDEQIDIDRASAEELARLPGVGPVLARRIVADRQSRGAFGSIGGLDRVPGIGPAALARLQPHLLFTGLRADTPPSDEAGQIDLNRARVNELDALPGIGGVKARAIVAFRDSAGPFRDWTELDRVPGISRALAQRLAGRLLFR